VASIVLVSEFGATKSSVADLNWLIASSDIGGFRHAAETWFPEMASSKQIKSISKMSLARIGKPSTTCLRLKKAAQNLPYAAKCSNETC
jgi:hypothetical protein